MKRFLPHQFEGKDPKRPAGFFIQGSDRNYAILRLDINHQVDQPYFTLFHEYTHSIVHQNFPSLPTWLDEGIADFYGATEIRSEHVFIGRIPVGRLMELRRSVRLPIETLLAVTHDSPHYQEGEKAGIFYAQSWAFVHYLFMDEKAQKAGLFQAYLKALSQRADPLATAREGFGDLDKLNGALNLYSRRSTYGFWNLPLTVKLTDKDFQSRTLEDAGALVVRAEFLQYTQHEKVSRALLEQALAMAPQRPEIHAALGYGYVLRGENEKACSAFEESLRLGCQDFRAPYYLARLAQEKQGGGGLDSAQILGWLEAAQQLRPDFPGVHMVLCRQYASNPRDPAKAIREGNAAVELEPQNLANWANLGMICINLELENRAKAIGDRLDNLAVTQPEKRMAASYAEALARFLDRRKAPATPTGSPMAGAAPATGTHPPSQIAPIKFNLPSYFAPLGREVIQLVSEGKTDEAIRKVEKALAAASNEYDRKALRTLLETLRRRAAPK